MVVGKKQRTTYTHSGTVPLVATWVDGKTLKAQVRGGKVYSIPVKNGDWDTANIMMDNIAEIKRAYNEFKRG